MLKKVCCSFLSLSVLIAGPCASEVTPEFNTSLASDNVLSSFFNLFNKTDPTAPLKEEIQSLKIDLQRLEAQQKQILDMLNAAVNDSKAQQDRVGDSEELQHILSQMWQ